ncbi:MAG: hypothetical protein FD145_432 [Candidatus Saganbacteria bacterium]|uniref:Uncharacterized protein n=1 Tax=Candidatus Saganbacteria bacterium TaxID=2575572 RepID=A0A833NYW0_UNCSA|nr:MAG: hypothetical protein FD145_432 [Candidatus Saganbacteria bacterium]
MIGIYYQLLAPYALASNAKPSPAGSNNEYERHYPVEETKVVNFNDLAKKGIFFADLQGANGWKKLSQYFYGTPKFADKLKALNNNASMPAELLGNNSIIQKVGCALTDSYCFIKVKLRVKSNKYPTNAPQPMQAPTRRAPSAPRQVVIKKYRGNGLKIIGTDPMQPSGRVGIIGREVIVSFNDELSSRGLTARNITLSIPGDSKIKLIKIKEISENFITFVFDLRKAVPNEDGDKYTINILKSGRKVGSFSFRVVN